MLFVNGISRGIYCNHVGYWVKDDESAFELLSQLVADEWTLEDAVITDGTHRVHVPVEAFDGQPILVHVRALQQEWNQLLVARPRPVNLNSRLHLKDWHLQLDTYYSLLLNHLGKMIFLLNARQHVLTTRYDQAMKLRLSRQFALLLHTNRRMYQQTEKYRQQNLLRLQTLESSKGNNLLGP